MEVKSQYIGIIRKYKRRDGALKLKKKQSFRCMFSNENKMLKNIILVDPASSYMLVSKIKPCMSKYTRINSETAKGSLYQLWFLRSLTVTWITVVILELIHAI